MRWDLKKTAGLLALTATLAAVGVAEARRGRDEKVKLTPPIPVESPAPAIDSAPQVMDQKVIMYDEVGYASAYRDEFAGQPTASGEPYHPAAYTAAHASLPLGTFAEVTNLESGKTVLVRINDVGPAARGGLIDLSAAAAATISVNGNAPVRVRRVNPPEPEKAALQSGQKGADRLDTPPQLLAALRKKLGAGPISPRPIQTAAVPAANGPEFAPTAAPASADNDGFVVEEAGSWSKARTSRPVAVASAPRPTRPDAARPAPSGRSGATYQVPEDGFIVEQAGRRSAEPTAAARSTPSGRYYVQLAAFSDEGRARAAAGRAGAGVEQAGNVWRVKKGPFSNEGAARSALGQVAANGYRDARITR